MTFVVRELEARPGELSFVAAAPGAEPVPVRVRSSLPVTATGDAVLALCLVPAMLEGAALELPAPVSRRLLRTQLEWQAIQLAWGPRWSHFGKQVHEIDVRAPAAPVTAAAHGRGVAVFFSGGVDSWSVLLDTPDATDLIFARGLDLLPDRPGLADAVEERVRATADELGLALHVVDTDYRVLADPYAPWEVMYFNALAGIALMHQERFERVVIAGWTDYATLDTLAANPLSDHLWSTEHLELVHGGGRRSRMERVAQITADPRVRRSLRVCWENRDEAYNCGRCRKCLMTMLALELTGQREQVTTFPPELRLDLIDDIALDQITTLTLWTDIHDAAVAAGRDDIARRIAPKLAAGKEAVGLPGAYHPRRPWTDAVAAERERADRLQSGLDVIRGSRSWRLTAPLRARGGRQRPHDPM